MRQISFLFYLFSLTLFVKAQSVFPYTKAWGTYVGGSGTLIYDQNQYGNAFHLDSYNNIYVGGVTNMQSGYPDSYYNQYVYGGGNNVTMGVSYNHYNAKFSVDGNFLKGSYTGASGLGFTNLIGIDHNNNKYYIQSIPGQVPNLATPGVWVEQTPSGNFSYLLSKYDNSNNLLWKTYIPNPSNNYFTIKFDSDNNIYLLGRTAQDIPNLTTTGAFQENFALISSTEYVNSFLVKLNTSGQRVWATYIARQIYDYDIYASGIYLLTLSSNTQVPGYATIGTFQSNTFGKQLVLKFNTSNGFRHWGTYLGTNNTDYNDMANDVEVNETGIYISGLTSISSNPSYFATSGAFKTAVTGNTDLYLTKFDFTGNRVWGTYFGSNNVEGVNAFPNLSLLGDRIVMTGKQYSNTDNISTAGAYLTTPIGTLPTSTNSFFVEFDSSGSRKYCSYFLDRGSSTYGDKHSPVLLNDGSLIIWGFTSNSTAVGTSGSAFPSMVNPYPGMPFGYIVKFNLKNQLGTTDLLKNDDLQLYDNPNNGNFSISGSILEKQKASLAIFDMSGKLIHQTSFEKKKTNQFNLRHKLTTGNYLLEIKSEKGMKLKVFKMTVR